VLAAGPALAEVAGPLKQPAIPVVNPSKAILIEVAHAGARLVAVGAHGVIVYSDDNGQSWRQAVSPTSETLTCVGFADAKNGWAAGGQGVVLHSMDGGTTWQMQLTGDDVIKLMSAAAAADLAANPNAVAAQRAVHRASIFTNAGDDKPFLSILPLGPQSAIIFGAYRMTVMTTDGGKTWVDWSLHVGDPVSHNMYAVARVGSAVYLAGEMGSILRSDDGGQNYAMLTVPDDATMFGILGTPKNSLVTFGVSGEVFRSTDQGQSWIAANITANSDLTSAIVLRSGAILLVSEGGIVFESKDDGQSYQALPLSEGMALYDVIQAANGDVVFVGSGGVRVEPASTFN
jgi:photosystem II stability/assembly factor-like uncharacterized protein